MSNYSYGSQMQRIAADRVTRTKYFDPDSCHAGQRVPYRGDDTTDDQAWDDAETALRRRGLKLHDDGAGLLVTVAQP